MPGYRILAITNMWPEDGHYRGQFVAQAVDALRRAGQSVDVEVVAQARGRADYLAAIPRVRARIALSHYDVVHVHFGMTAAASLLSLRTPRVISLYGSDVNTRWKRWLTRMCSVGSRARIYVSERLRATAGDPSGHVIPNGVDLRLFQPRDQREARHALGLMTQGPIILFGGSPDRPVKGYDVFRSVLRELESRGLRATPLILSAPRQPLDRVVTKYAAADLLLFTSIRGSEGSPTVVKEAVAMGLPVVSVDVGDVAEVLADVRPSQVVPFGAGGDPAAARHDLIGRLADRTEAVLAIGSRSNGPAIAPRLSLENAAARVVEVYDQVVSG